MVKIIKSLQFSFNRIVKKAIAFLPRVVRNHIRGTEEYQKKQITALIKSGRTVNRNSETILFWVPGGMPLLLHVEGAIALALRMRGSKTHAVICDGKFRACVRREMTDGIPISRWSEKCKTCKAETSAVLERLCIPYSYIGEYVSKESLKIFSKEAETINWENLDNLKYNSLNLGRNVRSAILRYLKGYQLDGNQDVVKEYALSGLIVSNAVNNAIKKIKPSRLFLSHGTYVDWGPALHTALSLRIPVIGWMASYLQSRFYFKHVRNAKRLDFHYIDDTSWEECLQNPFRDDKLDELNHFLENRYKNLVNLDMKFITKYEKNKRPYFENSQKPVWGILSHINWDCVSDYSPMAYPSFDDWILDTINVVMEINDVNWIIKIHPAEAIDNPDSGVQRLIEKNFSKLPDHIRILPATEKISPLEFYKNIDGGVTVYGTAGLELVLHGKPVILAGDAHYGQKGFTYDGLSQDDYRKWLKKAQNLKKLTEEQIKRARIYAYCYFIQRQIPLSIVHNSDLEWWSFQVKKRKKLLPGNDPFIDFICEKIASGKEFIMNERLSRLSIKYLEK